jgi:hypothetical protein
MKQNTKNKVKGGLLALLLAGGVVKGFAEERIATVIMKRDRLVGKLESTTVFLDTNNDKVPDTSFVYPKTGAAAFIEILDSFIEKGSIITFDNENSTVQAGVSKITRQDLISVDGIRLDEMFPNLDASYFPYAYARHTR